MKKILGIILVASLTSIVTLFVGNRFFTSNNNGLAFANNHGYEMQNTNFVPSDLQAAPHEGGYVNLETAAEMSSQAVVHITTTSKVIASRYSNPFEELFGGGAFGQRGQMQPRQGSGSGVIISADGIIVTNNHVVDGADEVTVTFSTKKSVMAKVIGKDPNTDLAVLKVEEKNLPSLKFGNSDNVRLGEWVLAVGYPLNLETTVTAGIVSAKYRNIGINQRQNGASNAVESFIQTDAAVNPGNSGGALVNARGELIGINSAIASPTGSYAGYSYAIPANLVKKVVDDMVEFGNVQRGYLGVNYIDGKSATPEARKQYNLDNVEGVVIANVLDESGAAKAGLKEGDIIKTINSRPIRTGTQLQEQIAQQRPGDRVSMEIERDGRTINKSVELRNSLGNTDVVKKNSNSALQSLGASFRDLTPKEKQQLKSGGVLITDIQRGALSQYTRIKKGFVITSVNDQVVNTLSELNKAFSTNGKAYQLGGFYPGNAGSYFYNFLVE